MVRSITKCHLLYDNVIEMKDKKVKKNVSLKNKLSTVILKVIFIYKKSIIFQG